MYERERARERERERESADTSFKCELEVKFSANSYLPTVSFVLTVWQVGYYFLLCPQHPQLCEPLQAFNIPSIGPHCVCFCFSKNHAFQIEPLLSTPLQLFPQPPTFGALPGPIGRQFLSQRKVLRKIYEQQLE